RVDRWAFDSAVRAFDDQMVDVRGTFRIIGKISSPRSDIAGKQQPRGFFSVLTRDLDLDRCSAEYMTGVPPAGSRTWANLNPFPHVHRLKLRQHITRVRCRVDRRQRWNRPSAVPPVELGYLDLLDGPG